MEFSFLKIAKMSWLGLIVIGVETRRIERALLVTFSSFKL